jgi:hypothetical protein
MAFPSFTDTERERLYRMLTRVSLLIYSSTPHSLVRGFTNSLQISFCIRLVSYLWTYSFFFCVFSFAGDE